MKKKPTTEQKKLPPEFDPILPLVASSKMPVLRNGDGPDILNNDTPVVIEMTYRSMYIMWEHAEALAKRSYGSELGGPFQNHADAILEACYAFRNHAHMKTHAEPLRVYDVEKAEKARTILAAHKAQEAKDAKKGRRAPLSSSTAGKTANADVSEAPKKVRCTARFINEQVKSQCVGPKEHKGKHKDKNGRRW